MRIAFRSTLVFVSFALTLAGCRPSGGRVIPKTLSLKPSHPQRPRGDQGKTPPSPQVESKGREVTPPPPPFGSKHVRLPAEFEPSESVILAWKVEPLEAGGTLNPFFASIIRAIWGTARIDLLVSHPDAVDSTKRVLRTLWHNKGPSAQLADKAKIRFLPIETNSQWVRDFGPLTVFVDKTQRVFIDALYTPERPNDDQLPTTLAPFFHVESKPAPFHLDGGNLLSNGAGECFTTVVDGASQLLREDRQYRAELFRDYFGCRRTYFLHPLAGEWTGHVDTLMTVVGPRDVLLAEYAKGDDAFNSGVLERNARFLARQKDRHGRPRFRVHRLRIPTNRAGFWYTYLNLQIVRSASDPRRGVILVPVFAKFPQLNREALHKVGSLFRRVHPHVQWRIEPIDADLVIQSSGAIHCVLQRIPALPHR